MMGIKTPTLEELKKISNQFNLELDDEELRNFQTLISIQLRSYQRLDSLPDFKPLPKYPRNFGRPPSKEENPYNAIAWIARIKGRDEGKLKGKRVCIKDNIMIAGLPMLNGSRLLE